MARPVARIITALSLGLALIAAPAVTATAAHAADVTISKIGTKKASKNKTVTIKPVVKTGGDHVKVTSKTLTVKKGSKVVAESVTSAKLKIGKYEVTQTVNYQVHVGKKATVKSGEMVMADCTIVKVLKDEDIKATIVSSCTSDFLPGAQTFTANIEWMNCDFEAYWNDECTFDEYWDEEVWWEGRTTDKKFDFDTSSDDFVIPAEGDEFTGFIWLRKGSYTFRDDNWVDRTKTRTQSLTVKKK